MAKEPTTDHEIVPRVQFHDLDPSLVRLALGADPSSSDEEVPTTPGEVAAERAERGADEAEAQPRSEEKAPAATQDPAPSEEKPTRTASKPPAARPSSRPPPPPPAALEEADTNDEDDAGGLLTPTHPLPEESAEQALPDLGFAEPPDQTEAPTLEQRPYPARRPLAETMLDVRTTTKRQPRVLMFFGGIVLFAAILFSVAAWIRNLRLQAAGAEEERRLERKLERLGVGAGTKHSASQIPRPSEGSEAPIEER